MAKIVVIGNEKGGSGKTTAGMHLIVSLLRLGFTVAALDLDHRQRSLSRYIENRRNTAARKQIELELPDHKVLVASNHQDALQASAADQQQLVEAMTEFADKDFIVIDTPGSNAVQSCVAHSYADVLVTPINDSFLDLDLIGQIHLGTSDHFTDSDKVVPGVYSAMLWEQKLQRLQRKQGEMRWVVVRNRLSSLDAHNKKQVGDALLRLSKKFGFTVVPGFGDRVIFKELFLNGLTLHDVKKTDLVKISNSMIAARQELNMFIHALGIPEVNARLDT